MDERGEGLDEALPRDEIAASVPQEARPDDHGDHDAGHHVGVDRPGRAGVEVAPEGATERRADGGRPTAEVGVGADRGRERA